VKGTIVLDASALIAVALHEPGGEAVLDRIRSAPGNAIIHAINVFEVVSKLMAKGVPEAEAWESADFGGILRIEDVGDYMVRNAVRLKQANPHLSLGDCFCLALAEDVEGYALSSDNGFSIAKTSADVVMFRKRR
jgi:PIN domain nuclease of toxin-antitoxin system